MPSPKYSSVVLPPAFSNGSTATSPAPSNGRPDDKVSAFARAFPHIASLETRPGRQIKA